LGFRAAVFIFQKISWTLTDASASDSQIRVFYINHRLAVIAETSLIKYCGSCGVFALWRYFFGAVAEFRKTQASTYVQNGRSELQANQRIRYK
jgi:hypothetical protein